MKRQTDRQTDRRTDKETDRDTDTETDRQRQRETETERKRDRDRDRQRDRHRQRQRQADRKTDRQMESERARDGEGGGDYNNWGILITICLSLCVNSLPHDLRYPMEVKTFKRKHFTHSPNHLDTLLFFVLFVYLFALFARHLDTKCIAFFPLRVLVKFYICISQQQPKKSYFNIYVFSCVIVLSFTFLVVIISMRFI